MRDGGVFPNAMNHSKGMSSNGKDKTVIVQYGLIYSQFR